jgi:hypothetical protein
MPSAGRGKPTQFIPIRFIFTNKLTKDDRLLLGFDALVLSEALGRDIAVGQIIHGEDHATLKVKTSALAGEVQKRLEKERLEKNRDKLFTFLIFDGVPWNNNNAEHAVKHFAALRRIIEGITSEKGIRDYLVLLSICETCKYMGLDFLDFLRSGEKDIHAFAASRRGRRLGTP